MSFVTLRAALRKRLDQADRGDRGWFVVTRVHLSAARLQAIATYLLDAGGDQPLVLKPAHYRELGKLLGIESKTPAISINRHYFLAMETPLRLLRRTKSPKWNEVVLTEQGIRLATQSDAVAVFEQVLSEIRFCAVPWYTKSRTEEYADFDIQPYQAIRAVMKRTSGIVDLDEFDLFVSRIRTPREIVSASKEIAEFRKLSEPQKAKLRQLVRDRIPAGSGANKRKRYDNWRDVGRHTFSLFSLGQSVYRSGNELILTSRLVTAAGPKAPAGRPRGNPVVAVVRAQRTRTRLRIPSGKTPKELLIPPATTQANTGADSEIFIAKLFAAAGWQVLYYNQRRGYGFDLWVKKDDQAFVIEVKSFVDKASSLTLTPLEKEAADHHKEGYLLIVVENANSEDPTIHVIQNPTSSVTFVKRNTVEYSAARSVWYRVAKPLLLNSGRLGD